MDPALREFRTVVHCHSHLSHDSDGSIEAIANAAAKIGINAVLLTDHYEPGNIARAERGLYHDVLVVPGVELRLHGGGSILGLGVGADFEKGQEEGARLEELTRGGALLAAGHVEEIAADRALEPFVGFEVYNLHAQFTSASRLAVALRFFFYPIDWFLEAAITTPAENLAQWDQRLARGQRLAPVAGHDAHENVRVFGRLGGTLGTYEEVFRLFSTRILATELSQPAILEGLRRGRSFVTFDYLGDAAGFVLRYGPLDENGERWAILGDAAPLRPGARLEVRTPQDGRIRLLRDGIVVAASDGSALTVAPPGPGVYRVEVDLRDRLWIISGPIYVESPAPS